MKRMYRGKEVDERKELERIKDHEKLILKQAKEDYKFFKKEIKLFMKIIKKVVKLLPIGWEYLYYPGTARTLRFTKTGLDYRGKIDGKDFISNECTDELNLIKSLCENYFKGHFSIIPVYSEDDNFHSMSGNLEKNIRQKNGRMKKMRISIDYYQFK